MQQHVVNSLTEADVKRHISHEFEMPATCRRLTISFHFTPAKVGKLRNMLTLTLFDPTGFRGAGHRGGNEHVVKIDAVHATPGYLPGPLPSGRWTVQIDTHMILPPEPCHYTLTISTEDESRQKAPQEGSEPTVATTATPDFTRIANPNPGWYRGDLHSHTIHSDASWDVPELVAAARAQGLDFLALTDHNTVSPLAEVAALTTDGFLTLGGQELTTFWGHAVCLGAHEWVDWRVTRAGDGMTAIARQLYADGRLYIIAHPKDVGDPYCTGCRWVYPEMMPGAARLVEVWNGAWLGPHEEDRNKNVDGLALWYEWLNQGHRLIATAGSDVHGPSGYAVHPGFNVVYAEALSEAALLTALAAGHLYLSCGPMLDFTADTAAGAQAMMGDTLQLEHGTGTVTLTTNWRDAPINARVRLVADGEVLEELGISNKGTLEWVIAARNTKWCIVEMRTVQGDMLALTNPIFFG